MKLLVGLDHSPRSAAVLRAAGALATRLGGRMVLFRAVGRPSQVPEEAFHLSPDELAQWIQKKAEKELRDQAEGLGAVDEVVVKLDGAWHGLCDAAREHGVDLIVIGSHGYEGMDRVLGTTAAKVVDHAPCSVLVVRGELNA